MKKNMNTTITDKPTMKRALTIYEPMSEKIEGYDKLKIKVFYSLGGYNYFSSQNYARGIYILTHPVSIDEKYGMESSTLMGDTRSSGFKILAEELNRKSQKKLEQWFDKVKPYANKISELYVSGKYSEINDLVKGFTPTGAVIQLNK